MLVCTLVASLVALPAVAFADMILPAFFLAVPGMILLIIPIIVLEGLALSRFVGLDRRQALKVSTSANVVSTLVGIPVT